MRLGIDNEIRCILILSTAPYLPVDSTVDRPGSGIPLGPLPAGVAEVRNFPGFGAQSGGITDVGDDTIYVRYGADVPANPA